MHDKQTSNQADKLEQLFLEVSNSEWHQKETAEEEQEDFVEVDVLQLPPRSEVHKKSKMGMHLFSGTPFTRLVLVILFITAVGFFFFGFYGEEIIDFFLF